MQRIIFSFVVVLVSIPAFARSSRIDNFEYRSRSECYKVQMTKTAIGMTPEIAYALCFGVSQPAAYEPGQQPDTQNSDGTAAQQINPTQAL